MAAQRLQDMDHQLAHITLSLPLTLTLTLALALTLAPTLTLTQPLTRHETEPGPLGVRDQ